MTLYKQGKTPGLDNMSGFKTLAASFIVLVCVVQTAAENCQSDYYPDHAFDGLCRPCSGICGKVRLEKSCRDHPECSAYYNSLQKTVIKSDSQKVIKSDSQKVPKASSHETEGATVPIWVFLLVVGILIFALVPAAVIAGKLWRERNKSSHRTPTEEQGTQNELPLSIQETGHHYIEMQDLSTRRPVILNPIFDRLQNPGGDCQTLGQRAEDTCLLTVVEIHEEPP